MPLPFKDKLTEKQLKRNVDAVGKTLQYSTDGYCDHRFIAIGIDNDGYLICKYTGTICP